jgi:hypothetical protein
MMFIVKTGELQHIITEAAGSNQRGFYRTNCDLRTKYIKFDPAYNLIFIRRLFGTIFASD